MPKAMSLALTVVIGSPERDRDVSDDSSHARADPISRPNSSLTPLPGRPTLSRQLPIPLLRRAIAFTIGRRRVHTPAHVLQNRQPLANQPRRDLTEPVGPVEHADVRPGQAAGGFLDDLRQL